MEKATADAIALNLVTKFIETNPSSYKNSYNRLNVADFMRDVLALSAELQGKTASDFRTPIYLRLSSPEGTQ